MPRYFFNIHDSRDMPDRDGVDLPHLKAVRAEAIKAAGEMLRDIDGALTGEEWIMEVTDEAGRLVLTLRFSATEHAR
jgi:hypothetical protein